MEKEKSAKLQQRILEYQSRMSDHLVETASYRQEIERMKRQNDQLERQNQGMKRVLENAVNNFMEFVNPTSFDASNQSESFVSQKTNDATTVAEQSVMSGSSALLSEEIDSRRTSAFSLDDSADRLADVRTPLTHANEEEVEAEEEIVSEAEMMESGEISVDSGDDSADETVDFANFQLRKSMAVGGEKKMTRKTIARKTLGRKTNARRTVARRGSTVRRPSDAAEAEKNIPRRRSSRLSQVRVEEQTSMNESDLANSTIGATLLDTTNDLNVTKRKKSKRISTSVAPLEVTVDETIQEMTPQAAEEVVPDVTLEVTPERPVSSVKSRNTQKKAPRKRTSKAIGKIRYKGCRFFYRF